MMKLSPVWRLIQSVAQQNHSSSWMAVKQQLQHHCSDGRWHISGSVPQFFPLKENRLLFLCRTDVVSWPEVERLFHQSVFESMPLTGLDQQGVLIKTRGPLGTMEAAEPPKGPVIPWDDPLAYAKQQLWNLQTEGINVNVFHHFSAVIQLQCLFFLKVHLSRRILTQRFV